MEPDKAEPAAQSPTQQDDDPPPLDNAPPAIPILTPKRRKEIDSLNELTVYRCASACLALLRSLCTQLDTVSCNDDGRRSICDDVQSIVQDMISVDF